MSDQKIFRPPRRNSAVAIRYETSDAAPKVVAKGYGNVADTIIRTARENNLHVHESRELVSLLMQVDLDRHIPPELYLVVAELLAWVYAIEGETQSSSPFEDVTPKPEEQ